MHTFLDALLKTHSRELFALYDAAQDQSLFKELPKFDIQYTCLYQGVKAQTLKKVAPYLIECKSFGGSPQLFMDKFWGKGISMLVQSKSPFEAVKHQLRKSAFVKNSAGTECYFRYYDSRAFVQFFEITTQKQMLDFFGEVIQAIHWHDKQTNQLCTLKKTSRKFFEKVKVLDFSEFEFTRHN
jgi:Domain of unknown function (DUF4123)